MAVRTLEDALGLFMDETLQTATTARSEVAPPQAESDATPEPARPATPKSRPEGARGVTPDEVARINRQIQAQFGVGTAGQWRSEAEDAKRRARTGRKSASDHVSGLAIDIKGDTAKLDRVAAWAEQQPNVRYVLWRTKNHFDHVHISFWGA